MTNYRRTGQTGGAPARTWVLVERHEPCVVPNCGVRSLNLDRNGMCPPHLWDVKHSLYAAELRRQSA